MPSTTRNVPAHALFFPAAALHAVVVLPLSVLGMTGLMRVPAALTHAAGHAHEMLFGYTLAVVAGYLVGARPAARVAALLTVWLAARVAFIAMPQGAITLALNAAFAILLVVQVAPRYLKAAKKLTNQMFVPVLVGIALAGLVAEVSRYADAAAFQHAAYIEAVLLFALLMLFMGGRIIAPAAAGQFYRQGSVLGPRIQPRVEAALIAAMAAALVLAPLPFAQLPAAAAVAAAGIIAAVRLLRWRLWATRERPDLWCLGLGYAWIAFGLLLLAAIWATGHALTIPLHALTIGALGTLTLNVMARVTLARARLDAARALEPIIGTVLIAIAAVARLGAGLGAASRDDFLLVAAGCWAAAFMALLALFVRARRP